MSKEPKGSLVTPQKREPDRKKEEINSNGIDEDNESIDGSASSIKENNSDVDTIDLEEKELEPNLSDDEDEAESSSENENTPGLSAANGSKTSSDHIGRRRPLRPPEDNSRKQEEGSLVNTHTSLLFSLKEKWSKLEKGWRILILSAFFAVLAVGCYFIIYEKNSKNSAPASDAATLRKSFLENMKINYPFQDQHEFEIFVKQVEHSVTSHEPNAQNNVFTLLTSGDAEDLAKEIAKEMVRYAASRFHQSHEIFSLSGSDISEDYFPGQFSSVKEKVNSTGTLLVINFEKLRPEAVRHFHGICDKYTPFVSGKAVIVLVLKTNDNSLLYQHEPMEWKECAESTMRSLWSELEEPFLSPLITRLSENIIKIYSTKK